MRRGPGGPRSHRHRRCPGCAARDDRAPQGRGADNYQGREDGIPQAGRAGAGDASARPVSSRGRADLRWISRGPSELERALRVTDRPIDLLVVGTPFLDVTLTGLERFPEPGEELLAHDLYLSPGGPAMTAVAAVRLGLAVALVAPLGDDLPGRELLRLLEGEGVQWVGPKADRTPITVLMPAPQGVAMATHLPHADISAETVSAVPASAVVVSLGRLALRPGQTRCYAVTGGLEIGRFESGVPAELAGVDAVFLTGTEATAVTGHDEPEAAA